MPGHILSSGGSRAGGGYRACWKVFGDLIEVKWLSRGLTFFLTRINLNLDSIAWCYAEEDSQDVMY